MMGMRMGPPGAPPAYNKQMQDSFHNRKKEMSTGIRTAGKTEEQLRKERQYQQQRDKLKQFGKPTSGGLDPNKLVDSIFGTSDKPKTKPKNIKIPAETDNGFGEFLSSPPASQTGQLGTGFPSANQINDSSSRANQENVDPVAITTVNSHNPQLQESHFSPPKQDKKDLEKMMFECSDLKAPQKAKMFHKPALKELHPVHHHTQGHVHHDSQNARKWNQSEELSDLFIQEAVKDIQSMPKKPVPKHTSPTSKHPPKPPPWLTDESLQPEIYKHVLEASLVDGKISTDRLYPILMLSGLPKEFMGHIWNLCNKTTPGQLIKTELYQILALIALAQNNYQVASADILNRCPNPPVPVLQQSGPPPNVPQGPVAGPQGPHMADQGQQQAVAQGMPVGIQGAPQGSQIVQQGSLPQGPQAPQQGIPAGVHIPQTGPMPIAQGNQMQGPQSVQQTNISHVASAPATLHVTQLPPAGVPQGMMGLTAMVTEEDDFADFQAAPASASPTIPHSVSQPTVSKPSGSFGDLMSDVKNESRSPVKDQAKYLYSVPTPDDAAIAATLSPQDLHHSNVENFFGSDDSSEGAASHNSLDDEYFDGYKSADSKPSDSTSQFSTDQSETEDFKNFENYLDEFQKRKEQKEKESPFHKATTGSGTEKELGSPSKVFPKIIPQKLPEPKKQIQQMSKPPTSGDDFSDFADFQSAPVTETKMAVGAGDSVSNQANKTVLKDELIGDEDKYAALRVLEFSSPSNSGTNDLMSEASVFSKTDENWADFQTAALESDQNNTKDLQDLKEIKSENVGSIVQADSSWADFESAVVSNSDDISGLQVQEANILTSIPVSVSLTSAGLHSTIQMGLGNNSAQISESFSGHGLEPVNDDWADFQEGNDAEFSDFQSSTSDSTTLKDDSDAKPSGLVSVKKGDLGKDDILGLFKVKEKPLKVVNSRDDDINVFDAPEKQTKGSIEKRDIKVLNKPLSPKRKAFSAPRLSSDGDDFMAPPPLDHYQDDEHDDYAAYSRGYDFDDMMMPPKKDDKEHKHIYGVYGMNQNFVVTGLKKDAKDNKLRKEQTEDDDNDSISSKDNDVVRPRFGLGKDTEDSQSVSSLDFVVSKRLQNLKEPDADSADAHSVSSYEFGICGTQLNKDILPESKSIDSLDLREGDINDSGSQESSDKEKDSLDKEPADDVLADLERVPTPETGLPVIGDRYSNILHDIPGSDKHAYEWQRCLDNCCRMIKDANNIFNSVSSSSVCNEIIKSTQGSEYIQGIIEIYRVVCKITTSMKKAAIQSEKLKQLLKDIDLAWNNLTAFLVGCAIMPDAKSLEFSHGVLMSDDTTAQYLACGVCLLSVDMKMKGAGQGNGNSVAKLTYGGRQYHAACANLWINCVDSTLPALKLPELL